VCGVRTLGQLHKWLTGAAQLDDRLDTPSLAPEPAVDLADVVGQSHARFAVDVAAAGAHHLMMTGRPASAKRRGRNAFRDYCRPCRKPNRSR
jgi:magnesium chelatase family protein